MILRPFVFTVPVLLALAAFANASGIEGYEGKTIHAIQVKGLNRTHEAVVLLELKFAPGDSFKSDLYEEGLQRLRNLQIFSKVEGEKSDVEEGVTITIHVEERWTTLPIFRALSGGGSTSYIFGLFDINSFGRYVELGGQYENLNGNHSGVAWFRDPRFLDHFLRVGGDVWLQMRNRDLYNEEMLEGAFTLDRKRIHLFVDREFHRYLTVGVGTDLQWDDVSDDALSDDRIALNAANGFNPAAQQANFLLQLYTQVGRLNYDVFKVRGYQSLIEYDQSLTAWGSDETFYRLQVTNSAFWYLPWDTNLGLQLKAGTTNTDSVQNFYYLGGLESVRGYNDGQFSGKTFWQANVEYRIPSIKNRWLVLQHVLFSDLVQTSIDQGVAASAGTGIRLISPKVYRLNLRLDVAYAFNFNEGVGISFGTQQFF